MRGGREPNKRWEQMPIEDAIRDIKAGKVVSFREYKDLMFIHRLPTPRPQAEDFKTFEEYLDARMQWQYPE